MKVDARYKHVMGGKVMISKDEELYNQEGLDVKQALEYVGDLDLYREILYDYYMAIDDKCQRIRRFVEEKNLKEYTVQVHAVKSSSRMIGASELAKEAEALEMCGHSGDWGGIMEGTERMLAHYLSYKPIIEPHMEASEDL